MDVREPANENQRVIHKKCDMMDIRERATETQRARHKNSRTLGRLFHVQDVVVAVPGVLIVDQLGQRRGGRGPEVAVGGRAGVAGAVHLVVHCGNFDRTVLKQHAQQGRTAGAWVWDLCEKTQSIGTSWCLGIESILQIIARTSIEPDDQRVGRRGLGFVQPEEKVPAQRWRVILRGGPCMYYVWLYIYGQTMMSSSPSQLASTYP